MTTITPELITAHILGTLPGAQSLVQNGTTFFFHDAERKMPFVTIVTDNEHDQISDLDRPGVFRLNIGVRRSTYVSLFGEPPVWPKDTGIVDTGHDFTTLDELMPHPVYASMGWVCILSPSEAKFEEIKPLIAEAHANATGA